MDLNNKRVRLLYNDDSGKPISKFGIIDSSDSDFIYIKNDKGIFEILSKSRIIRMEVINE